MRMFIKRYDLVVGETPAGHIHTFKETPRGHWVESSDYEDLQHEFAKVETALAKALTENDQLRVAAHHIAHPEWFDTIKKVP